MYPPCVVSDREQPSTLDSDDRNVETFIGYSATMMAEIEDVALSQFSRATDRK